MTGKCAGARHIPTPPQKTLQFPGDGHGRVFKIENPKKKCMKHNWNFQWGGGVLEISLL